VGYSFYSSVLFFLSVICLWCLLSFAVFVHILIPKYKNVGLLVPYCDMNDTADCEG